MNKPTGVNDAFSIASLLVSATQRLQPHSNSARLDAELLLCQCLQKPRAFLYTWPELSLTEHQHNVFKTLLDRAASGEPLAHITGKREFWSKSFEVTADTLIPRPDTEILVEQSLLKLKNTSGPFLDLGTGSGVIAICVAAERPDIKVCATDINDSALKIAAANAARHNADVDFIESDWFDNVTTTDFSVIASNPPYIAPDDPHLADGSLQHEPITALRSCDDGFSDITAIIQATPEHLKSGGWLLLEHGNTQGQRTRSLMLKRGFSLVTTEKDLSGNDRVTLGQKT